jgi:integrase/recombinase XerD
MKSNSIDYSSPEFAYSFGNAKFNVRKMIRNRTDKEGLTKVLIEVQKHTYKGTGQYETEIRRISTDIWINPKYWNKKKEIITGQESDFEYKNNKIQEKFAIVQKFVSSYGQQIPNSPYSVRLHLNDLSDFFPSRKENKKCLVDYIDDYITFRKGQKTVSGTLKEFKSLKNRLKAFDDYNEKKTYFEDVNLTWSDEFEKFLKNVATYKRNKVIKVGYTDGTVGKTYTILVTVLNHFYNRRKQLEVNLSDDFRIKSTSGSQNGFKRGSKAINAANPLTKAQLDTLYFHEFKPLHLQQTKDRFLWQCYTGIRYVDAFTAITKKVIEDGKGWLRFKPSKTSRYDVKVEQPLSPVALEILKKYNNDITQLDITNQVYNRELKQMFALLKEEYPDLNYQVNFGTYASRDTFISMAVEGHADWKSILLWVGQSSYRIMDRYIKIEDATQIKMIKNIFPKPQRSKHR